MAEVVLSGIRKSFGEVETIHGVDLTISDREFVVFVGPSGCGKSTLLRLIAGLEEITAGEMTIDGQMVNELPPAQRGIAMVFQSYALYPHMTVYDNMAFGLKLAKASKETIDERVRRAAGILQIDHLLERKPKEMSGGQRQRVAIGRAIVREPKVFLFDEPLSNLDAALRVQTRIELAKLHEDMAATMVYVTHDQIEAMTLADKIVVLNAGNVEQIGSPLELYHHPNNLFVAGFIGSPKMNFVKGSIAAVDQSTVEVALPGETRVRIAVKVDGAKSGDAVTLGVRPEHLSAGGGDSQLIGRVDVVEQLGDSNLAYLKLPDGETVVVRSEGDAKVREGDQMPAGLDTSQCHIFNASGAALPRVTQ
ncbi:sn-glycerol-3-phosphate ABC transporter ATP-binding protein UgpC [Pelagibius litoralis]|uniref:Sn-glycerol-3-phosphate ABC transporter ATP-binding protein UgpC n=1 Tax=Pelagibius litoralis TaxID=374515 RepID=A0A967C3Y2_9PROT|nr:sn-glycerol-3-phosphate ABC transporter ATP-binding protein UgpC [Pelagibius litoralis]NIA68079.1 sn-glycerol-3-phosphate ABC transporter ATP-binding protein UgpC [Pelagibius litoralis]